MKILTLLGTRPEIIRLSRIIPKLDTHFDHVLVYTGQNYDTNLRDVFFNELGVRTPDYNLGMKGTFGEQLAELSTAFERILIEEKPGRLLVLGDTNSGLGAIFAKRMRIKVYHMEAGNRCFDDNVPEEINRRIIDHSSDILLPYSERSRDNLLQEGIESRRIYVTGNPINEVLRYYKKSIDQSTILNTLNVPPQGYFLATLHRQENVDNPVRLESFIKAFDEIHHKFQLPVIVSTHPRTKKRIAELASVKPRDKVLFLDPFGFFDFVHLEQNAHCVLSDSGTVQEECALFGVPHVTLRDSTERPETIECGSNILSGSSGASILHCIDVTLHATGTWHPPHEYIVDNVSDKIIKILSNF